MRFPTALLMLLVLPVGALADAGFTGVGDLAGGAVTSVALGISGDGRVVVGQSESANGPEAFRFRIDSGIEGLGDLPRSTARAPARLQEIAQPQVLGVGRPYSDVGPERSLNFLFPGRSVLSEAGLSDEEIAAALD